jgi:hypothetical protein
LPLLFFDTPWPDFYLGSGVVQFIAAARQGWQGQVCVPELFGSPIAADCQQPAFVTGSDGEGDTFSYIKILIEDVPWLMCVFFSRKIMSIQQHLVRTQIATLNLVIHVGRQVARIKLLLK